MIPEAITAELIEAGRFVAEQGWVPATSGNFSRRIDRTSCAITRSGAAKGRLTGNDFIAVPLDGPMPPGVSAEAPLHVERYRSVPEIGAVLHVHTVAATVLSRVDAARGFVLLEGFEMHKALAGFDTHESRVELPIFGNAQDTVALAARVAERLGAAAPVPAYLLAGHGLYAWGATMQDARRHLEGLEFLLRCALEERRIRT
jgi:methylthioribulose-1-phosphate dehydratase